MSFAVIFGCARTVLSRAEATFFAQSQPWGFILFARNVESPDQLRRLCADLRDSVGWHAPIFIDQEGGRVARLGPPHWRAWPPALDQIAGLSPEAAARLLYLRMRLIAGELADLGIDGNCAPLADIARPETHAILRNRCYGTDLKSVVAGARAVAQACLDGGVLPVLKHIPGHGRATKDSHLDLPRVTAARADLDASDFAAFKALADLPLAMSAHIVFDALDPDVCVTQSATAISAIRTDIGFDGLLMTDDLSMQALSGSMAERTHRSLTAGCDLILHCNGKMDEMEAVVTALHPLEGRAAERAARAIALRGAVRPFDGAAAESEYRTLAGAHA